MQDPSSVVFRPEPGCCGGRMNPGQQTIPADIADRIDYHVWPSTTSAAVSTMARTICEHIDWEQVASAYPELFSRRQYVGAPPLPVIWAARHLLAARGYPLCIDMRLDTADGQLAIVMGGVGVTGRLDDAAWHDVAGLLTTCGSAVREPRPDLRPWELPRRPARPPTSFGKRKLTSGVATSSVRWQIGDWSETWWSYQDERVAGYCSCPAHDTSAADFGPARSVTDMTSA